VAVAHGRQILAGNGRTVTIQEDVRRPDRILDHPEVRGLLDLTRPVAVLAVSVLHFIPDADDPAGILARLRDAVVPDSYLVLSHLTAGVRPDGSAVSKAPDGPAVSKPPDGPAAPKPPDGPAVSKPPDGPAAPKPPNGRPGTFASPRPRAEVERFFAGFELVEPGVVPIEQWHPDAPIAGAHRALSCMHAGVGRKR
jgi:S-adenosyl methyltransferase